MLVVPPWVFIAVAPAPIVTVWLAGVTLVAVNNLSSAPPPPPPPPPPLAPTPPPPQHIMSTVLLPLLIAKAPLEMNIWYL
jgi:hypothetical protein